MNKIAKITAITLTAAAVGLGAANASGWGERCDRFERGAQGPGPGAHAMMFKHRGKQRADLDLTAEEVRTLAQARLIMRGNDRLKVGDVTEQDENTYLVQIVTVDGSLVQEVPVDKNQGFRQMRGTPRAF